MIIRRKTLTFLIACGCFVLYISLLQPTSFFEQFQFNASDYYTRLRYQLAPKATAARQLHDQVA